MTTSGAVSAQIAPDQQAVLDDLYWNADRSIRSIGEQFGLTPAQVAAQVTPFPSGVRCWWCGQEVTFRKRSERVEAGRRYGRLRCACSAVQPRVPCEPELADTGATILVPVRPSGPAEARDMYDASTVLDDGIAALATCGLRWAGRWRPVGPGAAPADLIASLADLPERFVVVPSWSRLTTNQGDALVLLVRLVLDGWRVVTSGRRRVTRYQPSPSWGTWLDEDEVEGW